MHVGRTPKGEGKLPKGWRSQQMRLLWSLLIVPASHLLVCLFIDFIYLLTHTERGADIGRGRSRLHADSLIWESIPGLQHNALSWRQMLNCWATQASLASHLWKNGTHLQRTSLQKLNTPNAQGFWTFLALKTVSQKDWNMIHFRKENDSHSKKKKHNANRK